MNDIIVGIDLGTTNSELALARDLAEYGSLLAAQFQYPGEPPFTEFYPAHLQFFQFLSDENRADALRYFQQLLDHDGPACFVGVSCQSCVDMIIAAAIKIGKEGLIQVGIIIKLVENIARRKSVRRGH